MTLKSYCDIIRNIKQLYALKRYNLFVRKNAYEIYKKEIKKPDNLREAYLIIIVKLYIFKVH